MLRETGENNLFRYNLRGWKEKSIHSMKNRRFIGLSRRKEVEAIENTIKMETKEFELVYLEAKTNW